jgi:hypothetical protein
LSSSVGCHGSGLTAVSGEDFCVLDTLSARFLYFPAA